MKTRYNVLKDRLVSIQAPKRSVSEWPRVPCKQRCGAQAGDEDGWDEALGYMDACGPGWHLQIARTTSDDGLANSSLISHASGLSNCFLGDSQRSVRTPTQFPCCKSV